MINVPHYQRNANQNYNEISPHTGQNGHHQKVYKQEILERVWRKGYALKKKGYAFALSVGM